MKEEPFRHVERSYPLPLSEEQEEGNEDEAQRRAPFGPLGLKLIGSWED